MAGTGLDLERMAERAEEIENERGTGEGGELFQPEMGFTKIYVAPPCDPEDEHDLTRGLCFIQCKVHYGPWGMTLCLDPEKNPIVEHPNVAEAIAERNKEREDDEQLVIGECPCCQAIDTGDLDDQTAKGWSAQDKWLWGVALMGFRGKKTDKWSEPRELVFQPYLTSISIWRGMVAKLTEDVRTDYTDPEGATLLIVEKREKAKKKGGRRGGGFSNIEYEVHVDPATLRNPLAFDAAQNKALDNALAVGGDIDLFGVLANFVKGVDDLNEAIDEELGGAAPAEPERGRRGGSRGGRDEAPRGRGRDSGRGRSRDDEPARGRGRGRDEPADDEPEDEPPARGRGRGRTEEPEEPEEPEADDPEPAGRGRRRGRGPAESGDEKTGRGGSSDADDKVDDELADLERELEDAADTREKSRDAAKSAGRRRGGR